MRAQKCREHVILILDRESRVPLFVNNRLRVELIGDTLRLEKPFAYRTGKNRREIAIDVIGAKYGSVKTAGDCVLVCWPPNALDTEEVFNVRVIERELCGDCHRECLLISSFDTSRGEYGSCNDQSLGSQPGETLWSVLGRASKYHRFALRCNTRHRH